MTNNGKDAELQDAANFYIQQLRAGDWDAAFHGLIDLDPGIVHPLIAAYRSEAGADIRSGLLRIIAEFRTPLALPLLAEALRDRAHPRWKVALDGLVTLASAEAVQTLQAAISEESSAPDPDVEYLEWLREALQQTIEALILKSDATGNA